MAMRLIVILILVLSSLLSRAVASEPASFEITGNWNGNKFILRLDSAFRSNARWDSEHDDPPVSVKQAIKAARLALSEMLGKDSEQMICWQIELSPGAYWSACIVTFVTKPTDAALKGNSRIASAYLPFAVNMDGKVQRPVEILRN